MFFALFFVLSALLGSTWANALSCENNQSNGTTYTAAANGVYDILCGTDFFGGDMSAVSGVTFQQCIETCDTTTGCVDVAYLQGGGNCYLKSQLTAALPNPIVWSARKHTTPASTAPISVSCNNPGTNGTVFTATTGSTYQILCGLDYAGGDLSSTTTSDFGACIEACESTNTCIDVSYVNGACYMKDILNPPVALDWVWTAKIVKSGRSGTPPPTALSCGNPSVNKTTYTTSGNRVYQILCGVDYLAGDMSSTTTPTFEQCMEACDAADGCVDVSYVAPSCYLKNTVGDADLKSWVWNARFMAPAVTTTTSGSLPTAPYGNSTAGNATTGATASLPTSTACAANTTTFFPAANQVNGSDYSILKPNNQITLTYIDPTTLRVLALDFSMKLPTVVLEDSNYIDDVSCGPNMQVSLTDENSYNIATSWPTSGFLVVTYFPGCNTQAQRGVYYVSNLTPFPLDLIVGLDVVEVNITDVATEMSIEFGTLVNTSTSLTSTCTVPSNATVASTPTPTAFQPPSTTSLSPEAKAIMDSLKSLIRYDANGNILATVPTQATPAVITPDPFSPSDLAAQAALQATLADAGLASPDDVAAQVAGGLAGTCSNASIAALPHRKAKAKRLIARPSKPLRPHQLVKRKKHGGEKEEGGPKYGSAGGSDDPDGWDYACDDTVTGFADMFGTVGELYGAVCDGHDAYQAGCAIDCMLKHCDQTETWYTTTSYYIYYPPPSTIYSFLNSWTITYPSLSTYPLGFGRDGSTMTCVNCNMAVNLIQFDGAITVNLTSKQIQKANINAGISWDADHVINVNANGPWTSKFNYVFNADSFDGIGVAGIFSVTPSMIYSIAYSWSTDSAVNFTAGAHLHVGNATANMNALSGGSASVQNPAVFAPVPTFIYPVFSTGSKVSMSLVMQALISMSVNIMGQISIATSQTIQNTVGLQSQYSTTAGSCPANNLAVSSFVSTNNTISVNGGVANNLYQNQIAGQSRCFAVPNAVPNPNDITALASVGGPYCTSYISYSPPTSSIVSTTTKFVPSTVTTTVTATVTNTPLVTIYPTYRTSLTSTSVLLSSTQYVYTKGTYSISSQYLKRDLLSTPAPTEQPDANSDRALVRRVVAAPTMISGWSPAKISYACSQIATGVVTTIYTATVTSTSGYTTATQTNTVNAKGPVSTVTYGSYESLIVTTITVTNPGVATSTVATACPLQTSETCLRIYGHGAPQFEGWPMAYQNAADANFQFGTDRYYQYTEWYLASDGSLYALESDQPWAVTGNYALGGWVILGRASQSNGYAHAKCTKDCVSKTIKCCAMGTCTWSSSPVNTELDWYYSDKSIQPYLPSWGFVQNEGFAYPLTLTYEDIQCPCRY